MAKKEKSMREELDDLVNTLEEKERELDEIEQILDDLEKKS